MILQSLGRDRGLWRASADPSYDLFVKDFWTRPIKFSKNNKNIFWVDLGLLVIMMQIIFDVINHYFKFV